MRFVLGTTGDYRGRLRRLMGLFVGNRAIRGDPMFGIPTGAELAGVALCTPPEPAAPSPELAEFQARAWAELGLDAWERYQACVAAWGEVGVADPNVHLNILSIPPRYQGRGLARPLLDQVHLLSREYARSTGVSLTTEDPKNVRLYEYFGYRVVGRREVVPGLETWGFFRPDSA